MTSALQTVATWPMAIGTATKDLAVSVLWAGAVTPKQRHDPVYVFCQTDTTWFPG